VFLEAMMSRDDAAHGGQEGLHYDTPIHQPKREGAGGLGDSAGLEKACNGKRGLQEWKTKNTAVCWIEQSERVRVMALGGMCCREGWWGRGRGRPGTSRAPRL
jgi:hypothetical protein